MTAPRTIVWFSCGAASAVAARLTLRENPEAIVVYCETRSEHRDNQRFLADCIRWFNAPVERISSQKYKDIWDVYDKRKYLSGTQGAPCTKELKVVPRLNAYDLPSDIHVFGYTADKKDITRAINLRDAYPNMNIRTPLIDAGLNKENVLAMVEGAGISLPPMYALGFQNNNCIPCVKATSPDYWSLVRQEFPAEFERMAKLSRKMDVKLTRIKDIRIFIDEIPDDWPTTNPIQPACDFMCHFAENPLPTA